MSTVLEPPTTWTNGSTALVKTGTWRAALPQHVVAPSPCHAACPVHGDIAQWIGQVRAGDVHGAWLTLSRHNPLPAVIGRVCHHPCENACNRSGHDEALAICGLERYVGDAALAAGWAYPAVALSGGGHVAVVGSGPAGLSAAYQLRRRGLAVTLFEAQAEPGGLLRYGIPAYRLARGVLDAEIERLLALGIELRCGHALQGEQGLADLRAGHDAVFLALGAQGRKRLAQIDYRQPWAVDGADYLARANAGTPHALGRRVVVVGGGSAAMDVARSARRAGHDVSILALEGQAQLPAQREEVVEALEEGIGLFDAAMLRAVRADAAGGVLELDCMRVRLEAACVRGPLQVHPIDGSAFTLEADAVISAIGQDADLAVLGLAGQGALLPTGERGSTRWAGVWAGGDLTSMARQVSEAIAMGERAVLGIVQHLAGDAGARSSSSLPAVELSQINLHYHPTQARAVARHVDAAQRLAQGGEVQMGLELAQALLEGARCFSCGTCTHCDNCVTYCPDLAVQRAGDAYTVLTDYCKGCGLCVKECPSGSMLMQEELR